ALFAGTSLTAFAAEPAADLVVLNGSILTVDASFRTTSAVAIKDGVFVAVGSDAAVRSRIGSNTRVIDARGQTVIPGLIESHVHATGAARGEALQPFVQLHSIAEIQEWVRQKVRGSAPQSWIQLPRVDATRIRERRIPTSAELTFAAPDNPAVFTWQYANRQVQILNQAAMQAAGITRDRVAPPGGKIILGPDGEPTGVTENCGALLTKFLAGRGVPEEKYLASLATLLRRYNELGITSITERSPRADNFATFNQLRADGRLPVRVTVTVGINTDGSVEATETAIRAMPFKTGDGDDWVRYGPIKFSVDGGALYGTAFMREPYGERAFAIYGISDPAYRGDLRVSAEKIKNIIRTGHRLGWQMSSHVTGDAGVDAVLDAVEAANADSPIAPRRYNLIHAYWPDAKTAQRAARLGVAVDTQPTWYYKDGDTLAGVLGAQRLNHFIGLKTWRDAGVHVAINADHMQGFDPNSSLNPYNPFLAMQIAVLRRTEGGQVFGPEQRVSREEALRMVTIDAAWMSFDETRKGSIEVGKLGDLAILTGDFMATPAERLHEIRSATTIVGGKVVYEKAVLRAGAAAVDITPKVFPLNMPGGFAANMAQSAHDPLHARALVLADGATTLALVVVDNLGAGPDVLDEAKTLAAARTGISPDRILISSTHSHSAAPLNTRSEPAAAYRKLFVDGLAESIVKAHAALRPAAVGAAAHPLPDEVFNRRWYLKPGKMLPNPFGHLDTVKMNPGTSLDVLDRPAGPIDPDITILSVQDARKKPLALFANYSLHYVGGMAGAQISADYFGEFARVMPSRLRGDESFVAMMSNGTSGDINNIPFGAVRPPREPFEQIRIVAQKAADTAWFAQQKIAQHRDDVRLGMRQREITLKYRRPSAQDVAEAKAVLALKEPAAIARLPRLAQNYAGRVIEASQRKEESLTVQLQALRIGDLAVCGIPFETFVETGLDLKKRSPFPQTMVIGLANGRHGYLPTPEHHQLGGYETWLGTNLVQEDASVIISTHLLEMLAELRK
ncbi:MAG: neutral/alkaline non-lysosomal ceramidase N-terminal domain-containing protein, partial [Planctomycetaceae bacterium]|nr:neutral/alkaline non-lysosomal ceramidase N-terminal domain-containing protein [Planctomycetaceae bacterium]